MAIEDVSDCLDLFQEPKDFLPPPPPPQLKTFTRCSNQQNLTLSLVGNHSLWAHFIWNAGMSMANFFDSNPSLVENKRVLELGAAAALPSLICALNSASKVVMTDYPDPELISNIQLNVDTNLSLQEKENVHVLGYQWGEDVEPLLNVIDGQKYHIVIMADLIFNHTEHIKLLKTCQQILDPKDGVVYVSFTHHVVKWADRDMKFFSLATEYGFEIEKLGQEKWNCMFPNDGGDEQVRSTVHKYKLSLSK